MQANLPVLAFAPRTVTRVARWALGFLRIRSRAYEPEVLCVSPNASTEVIKLAYRLRAHQYYPDNTEGLGAELRVLAERKVQELNTAFAWARFKRRRRGLDCKRPFDKDNAYYTGGGSGERILLERKGVLLCD